MPAPNSTPFDAPTTTEDMTAAYEAFLSAFPAYASTERLDTLRATEYARLDQQGQVYLDYTGGGLYAESQLREHMALLTGGVFGNPHSKNLTSMAMTELVEQAREYVLRYFNASPDEYMVIFTPNATGALKLVGEAYPFGPGDNYLLTFDNHNSVNGIREFARARGRDGHLHPDRAARSARGSGRRWPQAWQLARPGAHNLFAYPAQSNFSGVQHPLEWIAAGAGAWLGCAAGRGGVRALQPAGPQPLASRLRRISRSTRSSATRPASAACWRAKPPSQKLRRPWYSGGTITFSSVVAIRALSDAWLGRLRGWHGQLSEPARPSRLASNGSSRSASIRSTRALMCLTGWLIEQLMALRHSNGAPVVRLYGPANTQMRGGTVQVNFFDPDGPHDRLLTRGADGE